MREFQSDDDVVAFLAEADGWLTRPVTLFLLGGTALAVRDLKPRTDDVDFAFGTTEQFQHVHDALLANGFEVRATPTEGVDGVGRTVTLVERDRGIEVDLFERQVVGKVRITDAMRDRADRFWTGEHVTAVVLAPEDLFVLKAVSAGDVGAGRRTDLDDLARIAQTGPDWDAILREVESQCPFNTGSHEARLLRDGSHPLLSLEIAVRHLSGLPAAFEDRVAALATECRVEQSVLRHVSTGTRDPAVLAGEVCSSVAALDAGETAAVERAVQRLVEKDVVERRDGRVTAVDD